MTVPAVPLPDVGSLILALSSPGTKGDAWAREQNDRVVCFYRQGRDALAAAIEASKSTVGEGPATVWIPGYFCNEALGSVRSLQTVLRFYPIREDLTPNWSVLENCIADNAAQHIFVLVHYFGFPNQSREARLFCDRYRVMLVEDAAHVLLPFSGIGSGDAVVFSPRKLLAVPSGGVLVISRKLAAVPVGTADDYPMSETLRWLAKRLAQKLFVRLNVPWHILKYRNSVSSKDTWNVRDSVGPRECDDFTRRLLRVMEEGLDEVIRKRRGNYFQLLKLLGGSLSCRPFLPTFSEDVCPYVFPLWLDRGSGPVAAMLQSKGIPATQWPDLPPEILAEPRRYDTAISLRDHLLLLPVHQSLSVKQIASVVREVRRVLDERV